jgi:predicted site-specific integrase-resolvase
MIHVDDTLPDVTEMLTSLCARPYRRRAKSDRARRALKILRGESNSA